MTAGRSTTPGQRDAGAVVIAYTSGAGIEVAAWLPETHGPGALADYAEEQGAQRIFVSDQLQSIES